MAYRNTCAIAVRAAVSAVPAQAIVFNVFWTGDPTIDTNLVRSGDPTASVTGVIDINAAPGAAFTANDITSLSLAVSGTQFDDFRLALPLVAEGTIAADGVSATLTDFSAVQLNSFATFGCQSFSGDCSQVANGNNIAIPLDPDLTIGFSYSSTAAAQQSITLTAPIPLPAPAMLLLTGLLGLGLVVRRKWSAIKAI